MSSVSEVDNDLQRGDVIVAIIMALIMYYVIEIKDIYAWLFICFAMVLFWRLVFIYEEMEKLRT